MIKSTTCFIIVLSILSAFTNSAKKKPKLPDEYTLIPGGTMAISSEEDVIDERPKERITIPSFYISKYEVSNLRYREFLNEVKPTLSAEEYDKLLIDSTGWNMIEFRYQEPPTGRFYFRHPAFNNYPLVNVQSEGAIKYCEWLQQKIQQDNPNYSITVQLPDRRQWTWAARGPHSFGIYPWATTSLRNKKGELLCNFKNVDESGLVKNPQTGKPEWKKEYPGYGGKAFYTMGIKSFYPNEFKLYNMSGNVAEMINEKGICMGGSWNDYGGDVTITSEAKFDKFSPYVGFRPVIIAKLKPQQ